MQPHLDLWPTCCRPAMFTLPSLPSPTPCACPVQHFDAVSNSIWPALSHHCLLEIIYGLKINCALSNYTDSAGNMLQQHAVCGCCLVSCHASNMLLSSSPSTSLLRSCGRQRLLGVLGVARWACAAKQRSQYRKSN